MSFYGFLSFVNFCIFLTYLFGLCRLSVCLSVGGSSGHCHLARLEGDKTASGLTHSEEEEEEEEEECWLSKLRDNILEEEEGGGIIWVCSGVEGGRNSGVGGG
jgi:hypothetical protein